MSIEVKERPIIISGPMVCAILRGEKTQTRRVMNPQPEDCNFCGPEVYESTKVDRYGEVYPGPEVCGIYHPDGEWGIVCPYGKPGDRLWVRETWQHSDDEYGSPVVVYAADMQARYFGWTEERGDHILGDAIAFDEEPLKWRPSIHMPRWASRITLEVTDVRVERVQDISEGDAITEGCFGYRNPDPDTVSEPDERPEEEFARLWDEINAKRGYSWASNPWVWCVSFKVV